MPSSTASSTPRTASPSTARPCANHRKNPASEHEQLFELLVGALFAPGPVCAAGAPRRDRACRRARGRQGRCAPLTRWPEDGPSLTATARAGTRRVRVGAEGWCRSNQRMGRELVLTWWVSVKSLTPTPPSEPLKPSTGAAVRDHRNAVRDRSESLSAIDRNHCPHSPESADKHENQFVNTVATHFKEL